MDNLKLYVVKVKAPLLDETVEGPDQERLIRASNMAAVADYLIEIKRADAEDVARLMAAGVKIEAAEVHAS